MRFSLETVATESENMHELRVSWQQFYILILEKYMAPLLRRQHVDDHLDSYGLQLYYSAYSEGNELPIHHQQCPIPNSWECMVNAVAGKLPNR